MPTVRNVALLLSISLVSLVAVGREPWTTSAIKGTPEPPPPYAIRPAFPNLKFERPTSISELPGGRILVTEIGGRIATFEKSRNVESVDSLVQINGASVFHATAHPQFKENGLLFVSYSKAGTSIVSRFKTSGTPPKADAATETVVIKWKSSGHKGGCIEFGKDGMLYISTGDGSGPNPPDGLTAGQDVSNLLGTVLRIDVDKKSASLNYTAPDDNPFMGMKDARPEVWAFGLRNPFKFGIDPETGRIFAADNGWETWEMVHEIVRGGNCGWPIMEGRAVLRSEVAVGPTPIRPPVKDHHHSEANSVIGGPVYRGAKLPDLNGTFVYGDYITGTIWGLGLNDDGSFSHQTLVDTDLRIVAFTEGSKGELLVADYDYTGQIYELVPSGLEDQSANFPRRLSDTGLFKSLKDMSPAPGVVEYDVTVERWVDGAESQRWVAIPGGAQIDPGDESRPASYPDGTVFAKHLTLRNRYSLIPLETQLLHYEHGMWHPYSYLWNKSGTDASLVSSKGTHREVDSANRTWHVSAENECRLCHNAGSGFVLGFKLNQLSRSASNSKHNQVATLVSDGVLSKAKPLSTSSPAALVDPHDESQSLNDRARSYLHGNCSSCHHPGGNAIVSFYLKRDLPFSELKTNKGTGIGTFGLRNAKLIVPGDPYRSVLLYRMSKLGYARMPYIGSRVVDSRGVALITKWIQSMPHQSSDQDSQPVKTGSDEHMAIDVISAKNKSGDRERAAETLLASSEGALALSSLFHAHESRGVDKRIGYTSKRSDIRGLFETFVPEQDRRKTLGRNPQPETILSLKGDSGRGRLIFFSDGARCKNCHDVNDASKSTGPTLTEIRKKYTKPHELLQHVLNPSLKIDEKFVMWVVVTESGRVYNGLLVSENDDQVVLKTAEQKLVRINKAEIELQKKSRQSLMPEAVLSDLTAQEAADLLKWIGAGE